MPEQEERKKSGVSREYANDAITVFWDAKYCIHTAACINGLPGVFDPQARPWIDISQAAADDIAEVVMRCPTGALHFRRNDGGPEEVGSEQITVQPRKNGPLFARGKIEVVDVQGNLVRDDTRVAFCRCGQSSNKPFCDGTHRAIGFQAD
ncbi:MAG: (4Fe-4S)-binding protein [Chloroflexota bacterium]